MPKVKKLSNKNLLFYCPGCKAFIELNSIWTFNNDYENPTFRPSVKSWHDSYNRDGSIKKVDYICHSWITDGKIQFLPDSTHELKDQTIELPDIEKKIKELDIHFE